MNGRRKSIPVGSPDDVLLLMFNVFMLWVILCLVVAVHKDICWRPFPLFSLTSFKQGLSWNSISAVSQSVSLQNATMRDCEKAYYQTYCLFVDMRVKLLENFPVFVIFKIEVDNIGGDAKDENHIKTLLYLNITI